MNDRASSVVFSNGLKSLSKVSDVVVCSKWMDGVGGWVKEWVDSWDNCGSLMNTNNSGFCATRVGANLLLRPFYVFRGGGARPAIVV